VGQSASFRLGATVARVDKPLREEAAGGWSAPMVKERG
jgi:hypothetical protein